MPPAAHAHSADTANSPLLRACFGVGCARHHRCARYEAVTRSEASAQTLGTCLRGDNVYPLFIELRAGA